MSQKFLVIGILTFLSAAQAFTQPCRRKSTTRSFGTFLEPTTCYKPFVLSRLSMAKDDKEQKGMEDAFRQLDKLESIDGSDGDDASPKVVEVEVDYEKRQKAFQKALDEIDEEELSTPKASPETEVKVYTDMVNDLGADGGKSVYEDVLGDMGGSKKETKPKDDDSVVVPKSSAEDMEGFLNAALEEAVKEAKEKTPDEVKSLSDNLLDDEEMMEEIREVFEKANEKLLSGIEDIRKEQAQLAKASAETSFKESEALSAENAARMEQAQASMGKMLDSVSKETAEVEKAVADLKKAQEAMENDPLMKLISGDIAKQGAVVGALLFSIRSLAETVALVGGGGASHATAALIQGAIALACIFYVFFI